MSENVEIPKGWTNAIFGDLLDYIQPSKFIVESTDYDHIFKTPVLTAGKSFIIGYTNESNGIFKEIPVIIFDDFTTSTQFVNFNFKVKSSAMKILKLTCDLISIKYVFYFMQTIRISVDTHKRYWISHYSRLHIPLPPLPEQHRIVAKVEALFSSLDKGIESLKTAQQQLKVYRQAVLKWAFEGKLTNENVKDGELPEGWKWVKIGDISHKVTVGYVGPMKEQYIEFGVPFLRGQNVRPNKYDSNHLKYISNDFNELLSKSKIYPGDVLVVRSGNVGISCVVPEILSEANCADLVIIKKTLNTNSYYISYYLNSVIQSRILAQKVGVALGHFNTKTVERFEIPFPKIDEQHAIVSEIESRLSVCDKLEESITYSLKQAEALRQSVLKKAFSGKLVPQDPNDAPASVLLERIKAEKEKNMPDKKVKLKKVKN
jgi:type I restriction enzyme S subunit